MEIITRQVDNLGVERNLFGVPAINLTKTKITNKRQFILSLIIEEINKERPCKYKDKNGKIKTLGKVFPRAVAMKTSHLSLADLEFFLSDCLDYKNRKGSFGVCFFGKLKNK